MTTTTPDYDLIYSNEYEASRLTYLDGIQDHIEKNRDRSHRFLKNVFQDSLRRLVVNLKGIIETNHIEVYDQFFEWLCDDIKKATQVYSANPITHFMQNEYKQLRRQASRINHIIPEIYKMPEFELVEYLAKFEAFNDIYRIMVDIRWHEDESMADFLNKFELKKENTQLILIKSGIASIVQFQSTESSAQSESEDDAKITKVLHAPTTYAVVYFVMSRSNHKDFTWDDRMMETYLQKVNTQIPFAQYKKIQLNSFIRTVYKMHDKIDTVRLASLEAAKIKIAKFNSEVATDKINSLITEKRNSDRH